MDAFTVATLQLLLHYDQWRRFWPDAQVWEAVAGIVAAAGTLGAAIFAAKASRRANAIAADLAQVERRRYHEERVPKFNLTFQPHLGLSARLSVELEGPMHLDVLKIRIRDNGPVPADFRAPLDRPKDYVYGPYQFATEPKGCSTGKALGRTSATRSIEVRDTLHFYLVPSEPPPWILNPMMRGFWGKSLRGLPTRLAIECEAGGEEWTVFEQVSSPTLTGPEGYRDPTEKRG